MYNLAKAYRSIQNSLLNHRVEDWDANDGHTKLQLDGFTFHDTTPVDEHIYVQPFRMWNRPRLYPFLQVSQIFQRHKSDVNKQDFEMNLILTWLSLISPAPNNRDLKQNVLLLFVQIK